MEEKKNLKHRMLEIIEGGIRGSRGARIFGWTAIILILLSISFFLLTKFKEPGHRLLTVFEVVELLTVALFTAEVILGLWTADVRFPKDQHPRLRYLRQPMTVVAILAILPFYLGLILQDSRFDTITEIMGFLKLLHLAKILELVQNKEKEE